MSKKMLVLGSLLGIVFFVSSSVSALSLRSDTGMGWMTIENPYYKATILLKEGARINSLVLKETGNDFTRGGGIAEEVIGEAYSGGLGKAGYSCEIIKESPSLLKIEFTYIGDTRKLKGICYKKTFTFSEATPLIKVDLSLHQKKSGNRITGFRIHNFVTAGGNSDEDDVYFLPTTKGLKQMKLKAKGGGYVKDFTAGLAGVIDKNSNDALLFIPDYDDIREFYFWMGGEGAGSTIEWFYRDFTLEKGDTWKSSYSILPITLSSLSDLQASLKKYGLNINTSLAVKRPQKQMKIILAKKENNIEKSNGKKNASKNLSILWVGNRGNICYMCRVYRIEDALATISPKPEVTFSEIEIDAGRNSSDHFDRSYPVSVNELCKYDVIIFIDTPHWAFRGKDEGNLISYIKQGGNVIFAGDQGRGYKGTELSKIIPLNISHNTEKKASSWLWTTLLNDISGWQRVHFTEIISPVTEGIPEINSTRIVVHRTTVKEGAITLMRADKYPLLVIGELGRGKVISFPILASSEMNFFLCPSKYNVWDNALFTYSLYDDLWRNLIAYLTDKSPAVSFTSFNGPSNLSDIITSGKNEIWGKIKNNGNTIQKGRIIFELRKSGFDESSPYEKSINYSLSPGEEKEFSFPVFLNSLQGTYNYAVSIKDKNNKFIDKRDSFFFAHPEPYIKLSVKKENNWSNVFGKNMDIDFKADAVGVEGDGELSLKTSLIESSGKAVAHLPSMAPTSEKLSLPLGNLAKGEYRIRAELFAGDKLIDRAEESIFIVPYLDKEDHYPICLFDCRGYGTTTFEKMTEKIKEIASVGFNGVKGLPISPGNHYFAVYEKKARAEVQKLGMAISNGRGAWLSHLSGFNQHHGPRFYSPTDFLKKKEQIIKRQTEFQKIFSTDTRFSGYHYIYDEPSLAKFSSLNTNIQERIKKAFKERYGYEFPEKIEDKNFYYGYRFRAENMVEALKAQNKMVKSIDPSYRCELTLSPVLISAAGLDNVGIVSNLDMAAVNCYQLGTWEGRAMLDLLWGASNFGDNIGLVGSNSINTSGGIFYPEYIGNQVYTGLAHNCKGYYPYTWKTGDSDATEDPKRCLAMQKAFGEIKQIGPLFLHLRKERAKAGLLHPWATFVIRGVGYPYSYAQLKPPYSWLHEEFGHVDFLEESQVEKGEFINDYNLFLIPAMVKYLPTQVYEELKKYVERGGTLVAFARYKKHYNEVKELDTTWDELFSAKRGKKAKKGYAIIPEKAKVLYRYKNGEASITMNSYGKGKAVLIGSWPSDVGDFPLLKEISQSLNINTLISKSDTLETEANLFSDKYQGKYIVAVNYKREEKKITTAVNLPEATYYTYDLLTGEKLPNSYNKENKTLNIPITLSPLWGKTIAILPSIPEKLSVSLDKKTYSSGDTLCYKIELLNNKGKKVNYSLPVNIKVIDSKGKDRSDEYGGIHVLKGGAYEKKIVLADNDPKGRWRIEVKTSINRIRSMKQFEVK